MNINKVLTKTDYNTVIAGADVTITYRDALFMYHAFNKLSENMNKLQTEVLELTDNIEPNATLRDTGLILESMHQLLMPIAMEIVIPKESIDIYSYNGAEEVESTGRINLKKKQKYDMDADCVPVMPNN